MAPSHNHLRRRRVCTGASERSILSLDFFNLLNVSPVFSVRSQNFNTSSYDQPSAVLNGRVFQLGGVIRF